MSQSVTTLTGNNGSAVLTRRSDFNLGAEDLICDIEDDDDDADDDRDATLRRPGTDGGGFHFGTARKVNGTSERASSGGSNKNKKHFMFFPNKGRTDADNNNADKVPRRVERSKSELGSEHLHKKLIPTLSQGKGDMSETNKKLLAHWNSGVERGMKIFQYGFTKPKWDEQTNQAAPPQHKKEPAGPDLTSKMSTLGARPLNKSVDGLQQSLQNVLTLKKHFDAAQIFSTMTHDGDKTLTPAAAAKSSKRMPAADLATPDEKDCLQKFLELDHGEFEFIDDASATLTRAASPPANLSISSLANEIFQELGQSGLADAPSKQEPGTSRFRQHHQRRQRNLSTASMSAMPHDASNGRYDAAWNENLESNRPRFQNNSQLELNAAEATPKPASSDSAHRRHRRQRNLSSASMSAVVLADETSMTSSWHENDDKVAASRRSTSQTTDSQLVASLIADQTLFLRHHQKRKQRRNQLWSVGKYPLASTMADDAAVRLQTPLADPGAQQLLLRRCSSLTQTYPDEDPAPDRTVTARSSAGDRVDNGTSGRLSSPSANIRFLYTGKYRPAFSQDPQLPAPANGHGNNNDGDVTLRPTPSPWVLSSNLSSFARRRRSSSTSLHTYDDDLVDDNVPVANNNKKLNGGGDPAAMSDYR
jgi:hypothetical protein